MPSGVRSLDVLKEPYRAQGFATVCSVDPSFVIAILDSAMELLAQTE